MKMISVGGCTIGERNTDYHYRGFVRMGATVKGTPSGGYVVSADDLCGASVYCDLPSHTGTENLIMAASLAHPFPLWDYCLSEACSHGPPPSNLL